jgi:hypothetical protein
VIKHTTVCARLRALVYCTLRPRANRFPPPRNGPAGEDRPTDRAEEDVCSTSGKLLPLTLSIRMARQPVHVVREKPTRSASVRLPAAVRESTAAPAGVIDHSTAVSADVIHHSASCAAVHDVQDVGDHH